ncbi:MAG: helix-turn-helix domain-containing protein [Betaproteobacteria bacterium]|nr:helix-turn-helix domain-containing protein [Betaproteobacteria bacterium]
MKKRARTDFLGRGSWALCFSAEELSIVDSPGKSDRLDRVRFHNFLAPLLSVCDVSGHELELTSGMALIDFISRVIHRKIRQTNLAVLSTVTNCRSASELLERFKTSGLASIRGMPQMVEGEVASVAILGRSLALSAQSDSYKEMEKVAWGLALIGWAITKWRVAQICEICFRHAWPGNRFCRVHSQAGPDGRSRAKRFAAYRRGRMARGIAELRGIVFTKGPDGLQRVNHYENTFLWLMFPEAAPVFTDNERDKELYEALRGARRVLLKLGGRTALCKPYPELIAIFRKKIDQDTLEAPNASLIREAEIWLQLEEEVAPTRRGKGVKTIALVDQAVLIAREGYSKVEIARALGVAKSTVSSWLKRYSNFREAFRHK